MNKESISFVFISNYLNHHQIPFCNAMYQLNKGKFWFIQTIPMEQERREMGWGIDETKYPYLLKSYESEEAGVIINKCDVAVIGGTSDSYILERIKNKALTFRYSERIYKEGQWRALSPRGFYYMNKAHFNAKNRNLFMLCASAYLPCDLHIFRFYQKRMLKWGYFPEVTQTSLEELIKTKKDNKKLEVLWCGRFIALKHPELMIELALRLKKENKATDIHITMIGIGELRQECEKRIKDKGLDKIINIIGPLLPAEVRERMIQAHFFIATADYNEGWGAVINEAMSSACCVIASHAMGAVPFLINHWHNGIIFHNNDVMELYEQFCALKENKEYVFKLGSEAYKTINEVWSPQKAAEALVECSLKILNGDKDFYSKVGPCSKAEVVPERKMYRKLINEVITSE